MNGTSGFQEVRSSTSRSPSYRFLHEQRHQFVTGAWYLLHTKELPRLAPQVSMITRLLSSSQNRSAYRANISGMREQVPDTFFGSILLAVCAWVLMNIPGIAISQTVPITPSGLNTQVSDPIPAGGQTQYDITGGTRPNGGPNLFHSFGEFGVPTNNIANFLNTPVNGSLPATSNILGRVTGGNMSNIFGTIQTTGFENANLFLMNPTGFLFGPNATVNVGGMVAFTTADYLRLTDGGRFNAVPDAAADLLLSAAPVAAFGFLGSNPAGGITVQGSQLFFVDGKTVSLVGGDILMDGGGVSGGIATFNGVIDVASVASGGEVIPTPTNLNVSSFSRLGTVTLTNGALVDVTDLAGTGAGTVRIRGGQLVMDGSSIQAVNTGDIDGAPVAIDIRIAGDAIVQSGSIIQSTTQGGLGRAGDVIVQANNLAVDSSGISAGSVGVGAGGNLQIQTGNLSVTRGGVIDSSSFGPGQAGSVTIDATGAITVTGTVPGAPSFPSRIASSTSSPTTNAGPITIIGDSLTLSDGGTIVAKTFGAGRGGDVNIQTGSLTFSGGGQINTSSQQFFPGQSGPAGDVTVSATGPVSISEQNTGIFSTTDGSGTGGSITLQGQQVQLSNSASISAQSTGTGDAGNISINAGATLLMENYSSVTTQATQASGGNIEVKATDMVELINSQISASVFGEPSTAGGNITIDPQFVILQNSQILATATQGQGGNITITTNLLLPDANSVITASSQFGVNGTVTIQSPNAPASGKILPLGKTPLLPTSLLNQRCAALAGGEFSSFTVVGRDSLPAGPGGWLSSPLALALGEFEGGTVIEAGTPTSLGEPAGETPLLSLRQIAPPGFLTQAFAVDWSEGCTS
jgi:filamentous hemagglutinin family protein